MMAVKARTEMNLDGYIVDDNLAEWTRTSGQVLKVPWDATT